MKLILRIAIVAVFLVILALVIILARGYRLDIRQQNITPTGIISISAYPQAAKVYINGVLKGVTDINLTLPPDTYRIEVKKDGYTTWNKTVRLKGELVLSLDALLYPINPSLSPVTNLGVVNAVPLDQTDRVVLFSDTGDPLKDGIYLYESSKGPLSFFPPLKLVLLKQIVVNTIGLVNFSDVQVNASPDGKEAIFTFTPATPGPPDSSFLLSLDQENSNLFDITQSKNTLIEAWNQQKQEINQKILQAYPKEIAPIATSSFDVLEFSQDDTKVLYRASTNMTLPKVKAIPEIGLNQTPEERSIVENKLYVYDKKEDKNYPIEITNDQFPITNYIAWYSDSKHLAVNEENRLSFIDFDGTNKQTVYSGPFNKDFMKLTADGKILILTNFNPEANKFPDLYSVGIK